MAFVYHGVPRDMVGEVIYPLNRLRQIDERLYDVQVGKYIGRESVLDFRIPGLGLKFNDTVHCASIHPHHLYRTRVEAGFVVPRRPDPPAAMTGLAFEIPIQRIVEHPVVWYSCRTLWINGAPNEDVPLAPPEHEFEPFDAARYEPLAAATEAHVEYVRRMKLRGERGLMFVHIPHVLVAGPIDVSGVRIVAWDEPPENL